MTSHHFYPYPSWELNELPNENFKTNDGQTDFGEENNPRLLSVFGLKVDECDRLWMTDSGLVDVLGSPRKYAPTSVVIYDLKTNKLIRRFIIPESQVKDDSFFPNIVRTLFIMCKNICLKFNELIFSTWIQ